MAVYTNDLRLKEIATGDESGTWGTSTNTNLELIAEAFSFGTEAITTNADTHTTTIADGSTDPGRSIFLKYTGTLDSACTITIGPNTVSKLWLIENATSGSQNIIISQGSGANITIPNGQTKAIYSDGAGSGAAMVDAFQDLSIPDLFIDDDLTVGDDLILSSDSAIIKFGADADTTLTHTDGSGLTLNSTNKLMFNDASQFIQGSSATVLSLGATDEIDLTATAIDVNGTMDVSGAITSSAGATISVTDNSDVLTLVSTDTDDAFGPFLNLHRNSSSPADNDGTGVITFAGENDNNEEIDYAQIQTAATDVSDGTEDGTFIIQTMVAGTSRDRITISPSETSLNENSVDVDFRVESNGNANAIFVNAGDDRVTFFGSTTVNAASGTADGASHYSDGRTDISKSGGQPLNLRRRTDGGIITGYFSESSGSVINVANFSVTTGGDFSLNTPNGNFIINEDSNDSDFRVESNSQTHALFVNADSNRVEFNQVGVINAINYFSLQTNTTDGSDNSQVALDAGAGAGSTSRGAFFAVYGNEHASQAGQIYGQTGASGKFSFKTGSSATDANLTLTSTELTVGGPTGNSSPGVIDIQGRNHSSFGSTVNARSRVSSRTSGSSNAFASELVFSTTNTSNVLTERGHFDEAGDLHIEDGNLQFAAGHGINFDAVEGSGATSTVLDDYEEGAWTATVNYNTTSGTAATLSESGGSYTRIGRLVTVHAEIDVSNTNSGSGPVFVGGLPFTVQDIISPTGVEASGTIGFFSGFSSAVNSLKLFAENATTSMIITCNTSGTQTASTNLEASHMGTGEIRLTCTYFTAS